MEITDSEEKELIDIISTLDNINMKGLADGRTLLIHSAFYNCFKIAEYLLKNGADINAKDKTGFTPLHAAVSSQNTEMVEFLISNGASVIEKDVYGNTPLHRVSPQNKETIKLLLTAGADCHNENNYGVSAYQVFLVYPDIISLFDDFSSNR